jgi:large subunit ribosomal protein L22
MSVEVRALARYAKMSPLKVRQVARGLRGMHVLEAQETLKFIPRKSARLLKKVLDSAVANAENNLNLSSKNLFIKEITVGEGPAQRRFMPTARGSAHPYKKRTSHICFVLSELNKKVKEVARGTKN